MAVFLANVGVNSSHAGRGLESPLRPDGTFTLLPIPERMPWQAPMQRLADISGASACAPERWLELAIHHDPDLTSAPPTYGDNCRTAGRAFSLRRAELGDLIVFVARLKPAGGVPLFALAGRLRVTEVLRDVDREPGPGWWDSNAHVRRARATGGWNRFWVFRGGPGSGLMERAVVFDRDQADRAFAGTWTWPGHRTELQTIGSYTRAVRRLVGSGEEHVRRLVV
jgi:hypothetical protein